MSQNSEEPVRNPDKLHKYGKFFARHRGRRPPALGVLTFVALIVTALVLAYVLQFAYFFSKSLAEEFCESAPGGRGYSGDKAPEEVSAVCSWARS